MFPAQLRLSPGNVHNNFHSKLMLVHHIPILTGSFQLHFQQHISPQPAASQHFSFRVTFHQAIFQAAILGVLLS